MDEEDRKVNLVFPSTVDQSKEQYLDILEELSSYFSLEMFSPHIVFNAYSPKMTFSAALVKPSVSTSLLFLNVSMILTPKSSG